MNLKRWVLWLVVLAFLASEFLLFTANREKDALNAVMLAQKQRADDLQAQLDQLQSSSASQQNSEVARLRADNQDLPRLRNEVTQARATNQALQASYQKLQASYQKLYQQLNNTLTVAQQQQAQLQQIAEADRQARALADQRACINNLRQIDAAKQQWALENNKPAIATPTVADLLPYFKDGVFPVCPAGGIYTIGAVGELPACSIPGHTLVLRQ